MFIRSERLFLRPGWAEDAEDLHRALADERIVRNLARVPWPYTPEHARAYLDRPVDRALPQFLITLPGADGTRIIGALGLHDDGGETAVGYWIGANYWGQGYATEALRAVLSLARSLGHVRLAAHAFADNPASARILTKLGFRPTGRAMRPSVARGGLAPSLGFAVELAGSGNCDDAGSRMKRAA